VIYFWGRFCHAALAEGEQALAERQNRAGALKPVG